MLNVISHLLKMSGALKRAESLAGRAGRGDLQDLRSSRISTLTRVVQVVVPSDGVVNWIGPLESLLDIVIIGFMVVLGRGPLCQVPFGRPEEANKVGRQVNVELLFFSKLSIGPDNNVCCLVRRPIWRLTEGKHIVKLEITWQLPRTQTSRQTNQHRYTAKKPADGVTGGVTKMADKMAEKKMAAPMRKMEDDELNVAVCSTPSTPQHSMASSEGPSTTHSSVDTTTDHSPEGEWKEVVSRKTKKKLSMSPPKSPPVKTKKEDPNVRPGRKTPPPPPKKPRVRSPLKEQGREKLIAGDGRQYPLHEKYYLVGVVTDRQPNNHNNFLK